MAISHEHGTFFDQGQLYVRRKCYINSAGRRSRPDVLAPAGAGIGIVLPTPQTLREQSQAYREAAQRAEGDASRILASYALVLAQVAEAAEREGGHIAPAKADSYGHLLASALSYDLRQLVKKVVSRSKAVDMRSQVVAWRMRAEELRTTADQFEVPSAQESLRRAAANYEKIADHAEALLTGQRPAVKEEQAD
jgi:hypothetical protein